MPEKKEATSGTLVAGIDLSTHSGGAQAHSSTNGDGDSILVEITDLLGRARIDASEAILKQVAETLRDNPDAKLLWQVRDLLAAKFPDPVWAVPNLLPAGLTVLAGRPKLGKSWLALQIAVACGTGGNVMGEQVQRRRVLYLALEDGHRRLQDRLRSQQCPEDASLTVVTEWPLLIETGLDHLTKLAEVEGYELIVVDTLARFARIRKAEQQDLITERLDAMQRWAVQRNVAIVLVHHHRKAGASMSDLVDDVMGATSITGMADAVLGLYRGRGQRGAELKMTGRDILERELAIEFDQDLHCWQLLGEAGSVRSDTLQGRILSVLETDFDGEATVGEIAAAIDRHRENVRKEVAELVATGKLERIAAGRGRQALFRLKAQPAPGYGG